VCQVLQSIFAQRKSITSNLNMVRIASSVLSLFSLVASVGAFAPSQMNQRRVGTPSISNSNRRLGYDRTTILILAAKIGVFFGSSTGNTETIAEKICVQFGEDAEGPFDIDDIAGSLADKFAGYDALVVGTPTWNTGADTERSGTAWDEIYYGEMQGKIGVHVLLAFLEWNAICTYITCSLHFASRSQFLPSHFS
jgi:hypothetical protein